MKQIIESWSGRIQPLVWNLIIVATAIVIGLILKPLVGLLLIRYKKQDNYSLFKSIVTHISAQLTHFIPLLMLNLMIPLMVLDKDAESFFSHTVEIALVVSFAILLVSAINVLEDYVFHVYDLNKADNLKERKIRTQIQFIRRILATLIIVITIAIILLSFENVRRLGTDLLAGVGIGGIIIGFAAQHSLSNFLAGLQIAFTQPIRIDDVLVVEGEWGRVEDITLTYVVLNIWDQRRLILPINYFIEKPFQNWTRNTSEILGTVFLYLDYNTPIDALREEFDRLLETTELWDKRVKNIQVTDAKTDCIEVRVLVSALDSSQAFSLRCFIRENLIKFIRDHHPESLPLNRVTVKNTDLPEKKVTKL